MCLCCVVGLPRNKKTPSVISSTAFNFQCVLKQKNKKKITSCKMRSSLYGIKMGKIWTFKTQIHFPPQNLLGILECLSFF